MSNTAVLARDRRLRRRQETRDEILANAWELVRERGVAGLTMRDLGTRAQMTAQALYSYFPSKHAIYDAMFASGYRQILAALAPFAGEVDDPEIALRRTNRVFFELCVSDPARFQLLFQRTIPGFEPSADSYAAALELMGRLADGLGRLGIDQPADVDLWTAVISGLASQQIANDPGGSRWEELVDEAIDMLLAHLRPGRVRQTAPSAHLTGKDGRP